MQTSALLDTNDLSSYDWKHSPLLRLSTMNLSGHLFVLFSASFSHRLLHHHPFKCPPQLLPQGKQCSAEACQLFVQEKHSVFGHCSKVGPQREGKITILVLPFSSLSGSISVDFSCLALLFSFWISDSLTRPDQIPVLTPLPLRWTWLERPEVKYIVPLCIRMLL